MQDWRRQNIKLRREQRRARDKFEEVQRRKNQVNYADNKFTIRNFTPLVAEDPKGEVKKLLDRLAIRCGHEDFFIVDCAPMLAQPQKYQVTVEAKSAGLKFDVLTKFLRLAECDQAAVNTLTVKDSNEAADLYKVVKTRLFGRKGLHFVKIVHDQVVVHLIGEENPREIEEEDQVDQILQMIPQISGRKRRRVDNVANESK